MIVGRKTIVAVSLAAAAAGLGFACGSSATNKRPGSSLPAAGSPKDDGTGLLARWSVSSPESGSDLAIGGGSANVGAGGSSYGGSTYGMYGGSLYGGNQGGSKYGGSLYANYRFNANYTTASPYALPPPAPATTAYTPDYNLTNGGTIEGVVKWPKPPVAATSLPASEGCADSRANPTLTLGSDNRVANAVVYIENITKGRAPLTPIGGILEHVDCSFRPHVQIMGPVGTALRLTSSDEGARTFRVTPRKEDEGAESQELELKRRGQTGRRALSHAGTYEVDTNNDADPATAWVIVPSHPYYAITDDDGSFRLDTIPPGSYTLAVWHPPVITGAHGDGTPKWTAAFVTSKQIKVTAKKATSVTFTLPSGR